MAGESSQREIAHRVLRAGGVCGAWGGAAAGGSGKSRKCFFCFCLFCSRDCRCTSTSNSSQACIPAVRVRVESVCCITVYITPWLPRACRPMDSFHIIIINIVMETLDCAWRGKTRCQSPLGSPCGGCEQAVECAPVWPSLGSLGSVWLATHAQAELSPSVSAARAPPGARELCRARARALSLARRRKRCGARNAGKTLQGGERTEAGCCRLRRC